MEGDGKKRVIFAKKGLLWAYMESWTFENWKDKNLKTLTFN